MQPRNKSRIEVKPKTDQRSLMVIYDSEIDDFDAAITQAIAFHNIRDGPYECHCIAWKFYLAEPPIGRWFNRLRYTDEHTGNRCCNKNEMGMRERTWAGQIPVV